VAIVLQTNTDYDKHRDHNHHSHFSLVALNNYSQKITVNTN